MGTHGTPRAGRFQGLRTRLEGQAWFTLARDTLRDFFDDKAPRLGAAISYYTLFSLAPLLVIALAIAGLFFGAEASQGRLTGTLEGLLGPQGAEAVEGMIERANRPGTGLVAALLGVLALLFGASGVFGQLQAALDTVWDVKRKKGRGVMGFVKDRFFSFAMVVGVGFLLLVSLVVSAALSAVGDVLRAGLPGGELLWQVVNLVVSLGVTALLFALLFKVVPDVEVSWRDVLVGGLFTAVLFTVGKLLIGLYLGRGSVGSVYGAAGSLVIVLLWVYYSAQIFFLGAEFTQVYAERYGAGSRPDKDATRLEPPGEERRRGPTRKGA